MADPVTGGPEELRPAALPEAAPERALHLLRRPDFRRAYAAVVTSELGDAFQYVALMWSALVAGGPLGVLVVRLADSVPALVFGFHGGVLADRIDRRRLMIGADLVRAAVLVPVSAAALAGHLSLWGLVVAAFVLAAATSYFEPAYGALLPGLVERRNVQQANGLVRSSADALTVLGWSAAGALLAVLPIGAFYAVNAVSFLVSAALLLGVSTARRAVENVAPPRVREGFAALRLFPALAIAVGVFGVGVTIASGTWIVGVPQFVRHSLHRGAGSFSLVAASYALGAVVAGMILARRRVRRKALVAVLAWSAYVPGYGLFALGPSLGTAIAGALCCGIGQGSAWVLVNAAAQEQVPDRVLGRVMGLISLVHRGAHATGLLFVAPFFAVAAARTVFAASALGLGFLAVGSTVAVLLLTSRRADGSAAPG